MPSYCQDVNEAEDTVLARKCKFMLAMSGLLGDGLVKYRRTPPLLPHTHKHTLSWICISVPLHSYTKHICLCTCVFVPRWAPSTPHTVLLNVVQLQITYNKVAIQAEKRNMYLQSANVDSHRNIYKKTSICKKKQKQKNMIK